MHVCYSMSESRVIDRYFFDDDTINGQNSHSMCKEFFGSELKRLLKANSAIFREDATPPHLSRDVRQSLDKIFPNWCMGRDDPIKLAPHVPLWTFFYGDMLTTMFTSHQFVISTN